MPVAHSSDLDLARRIAAGEDAAAEELLGVLSSEMYGFARRLLRDAIAAEDALQETLIAMLQGAEKFDGRVSLRAWGYGILRHKIGDVLRRRGREAVVGELDPERDSFDATGHWKDVGFQPWNEAAETLEVVRACMDQLPRQQREALELFALNGLDGAEASAAL